MNTFNNKKKKKSQDAIEREFVKLIQNKNIQEISVTEICQNTKLNRSTFYANYIDIYDLADKIKERLENEIANLYQEERTKGYNSNDFTKIFYLVKDNPLFFKTYFKLEKDIFKTSEKYMYDTNLSKLFYNDLYIDYHIAFFKAGFNAILKMWLNNGCVESPEEIMQIIREEYKDKIN